MRDNANTDLGKTALVAVEALQQEYDALSGRLKAFERENGRARSGISMVFNDVREIVLGRPVQDQTVSADIKGRAVFDCEYTVVKTVFKNLKVDRFLDKGSNIPVVAAFMWGNAMNVSNMFSMGVARTYNVPLILCEDGFLKSADTWANKTVDPKYTLGCSLVFDTRTCYYDATKPSTVELMLNDKNLIVTEEEKAEARRIIKRIVDNKLTKYNHQPIYTPEVGRHGHRKVLVVDQSYGDFAIRRGWADDSTFENMLAAAIRENPDADILVKTHPDTMTGARKGYFDNLKEHDNVFRVTMPINPYSLMEVVDKVYVCSTQFGFEALMAGKEVHVFGMPFYAGWGLTIDAQNNPRRTNTRTLEEVFHIFYCLYTHWIDPSTNKPCTIDESIDYLIRLRAEYKRIQSANAGSTVPVPAARPACEGVGPSEKMKVQTSATDNLTVEEFKSLFDSMGKLELIKLLVDRYQKNVQGCADLLLKSNAVEKVVSHGGRHVGIYYFQLKTGGVERLVQYSAAQLIKRGYKVTIILESPLDDSCYPVPEGVEVAYLPRSVGPQAESPLVKVEALSALLRTRKIDVFYSHMYSVPSIIWDMLVCKWVAKIPFVLHYHSSFASPMYFVPPPEWFMACPKVMLCCDQVFSLSRIDSLYFNAFGINAKYISNPIPEPLRQKMKHPKSLPDDGDKTVLWVGRITRMKHPVDAVRIFAELHRADPQTKLVMVGGGDAAICGAIKRAVEEFHVQDAVSLVGEQRDPNPYYERASVFLATSEFEGFPLTSMEALCHGLPVVAYSIPHVELYRGNPAVTQVPQGGVAEAAEALRRILNDPGYAEMSKAAGDFMSRFCDADFVSAVVGLLDGHGESDLEAASAVPMEDVSIMVDTMRRGIAATCRNVTCRFEDMRRAVRTNSAKVSRLQSEVGRMQSAMQRRPVQDAKESETEIRRQLELSKRRESALKREVDNLKHAEAYRAGMILTWPLRRLHGVFSRGRK